MPNLLQIQDLNYSIRTRTLFDAFSAKINKGDRIAIIGDNGAGKSTLLKILAGEIEPSSGKIRHQPAQWTYVPQIIDDFTTKSGSERFNARLSLAIAEQADVLLLDEPTNHLDTDNRRSLMAWLRRFDGTLIFASHDDDLIRALATTIWLIEHGKIRVFSGTLDELDAERARRREKLEHELAGLSHEERKTHDKLMKEQERAKKAKENGEKKLANKQWLKAVFNAKKAQGEATTGRKRAEIRDEKAELQSQIRELRPPRELVLHFHLQAGSAKAGRTLLSITNGSFGWGETVLASGINLHLGGQEVLHISGANGSGKTTFIRALLDDPAVERTGDWNLPFAGQIGLLDQHYSLLNPELTVRESVLAVVPDWSEREIRDHLLGYLFQTNEDVEKRVQALSGGEKLRLSLAVLSAKTPPLLILDEPTNNSDRTTRAYLLQALVSYPGSLVIISHDGEFMRKFQEKDEREWGGFAF